jgi:hypothetical protein
MLRMDPLVPLSGMDTPLASWVLAHEKEGERCLYQAAGYIAFQNRDSLGLRWRSSKHGPCEAKHGGVA